LRANYPRIEACYYDVELDQLPLRKVFNLTYSWLVDTIGGTDDWEKNYAPIFNVYEHPDFDYVDLPANSNGLIFGGV